MHAPGEMENLRALTEDMEMNILEGLDRSSHGVPEQDFADATQYPVHRHRTAARGMGDRPGLAGAALLYNNPHRLENFQYNEDLRQKQHKFEVSLPFYERCMNPKESSLIN